MSNIKKKGNVNFDTTYILSSLSHIRMKLYLILLPLVFGFSSSYAQTGASKDISCQQTLTNDEEYGAIYYVSCRDFSSSVEQKNRIDSCVLMFFSDDVTKWGWNFYDNAKYNWIHPVGLKPPTKTSCSMTLRPTDELTKVVERQHDKSKGNYFEIIFFSYSDTSSPSLYFQFDIKIICFRLPITC